MKKRPTENSCNIVEMIHSGIVYQFPKAVPEKYRTKQSERVPASKIFASIDPKYTKPGALLKRMGRIILNTWQTNLFNSFLNNALNLFVAY